MCGTYTKWSGNYIDVSSNVKKKKMEVKYQVFVSSTYRDLQDERQEVMQALLELDCIPVGMELFPATDDDQPDYWLGY